MELEDIKQTIAAHDEDREGLVGVDLEALRADPRAATALPPATLARALAAAADRIAALEREIVSHERENTVLRDQLARLQDEHSYTRGRTETLHEVIAALHGNLEDLRLERTRRGLAPGVVPPALAAPERETEPPFRLRDQRGSCQ
jgi:chromosome segregation ATPase